MSKVVYRTQSELIAAVARAMSAPYLEPIATRETAAPKEMTELFEKHLTAAMAIENVRFTETPKGK